MSTYYVHAEHQWTYKVEADSPEDAEQIVADGDAGQGECTGYSIDSVTADEHGYEDDLRQPGQCKGCQRELEPGHNECTKCLLARIDTEHVARSSVLSVPGAGEAKP